MKRKNKREKALNEKQKNFPQENLKPIEKFSVTGIKWSVYFILFVPLLVLKSFFFPFIASKSLYFMALTEIIFFLWLILMIFSSRYWPKLNLLNFALILFLFILSLASIFGVDPSRSFWSNYERMAGLLMYFHFFAFFLVLSSVFQKKEEWLKFFSLSVGVALLVSFFGLLAKGIGEEKVFVFVAKDGSTLGNSSFLATYLLFNIFFAFYLLFEAKRKFRHYLIFALIILFLALFSSGGRAASLATLIGFGFIFLFYLSFRIQNQNFQTFGKVALISTMIFLVAGIILLNIPQSFLQQKLIEYSSKARPLAWQMAISGVKERPLLGWGLESFELIFDKYFHPCFFLPECGGEPWFDRAHNLIFDTLSNAGILGLFAFLFLFFSAFYLLFKIYFLEKNEFWIFAIFSSLLISYFLQGLTVFDAPASYLMFFLTFAFLSIQEKSQEKKIVFLKTNFRRKLLVLIFFFLFLSSFQNFIIRPAKASRGLIEIIATPFPTQRLRLYREVLEMTPLGKYQLRTFTGEHLMKLAIYQKASREEFDYICEQIEKSIQESPLDFRSHLVLGQLYLLYGQQFDKTKFQNAEIVLDKAIKISPNNQRGYWIKAQLQFLQGNCKEALSLAQKALSLAPRLKYSQDLFQKIKKSCQTP